jgi:hypothetical protein
MGKWVVSKPGERPFDCGKRGMMRVGGPGMPLQSEAVPLSVEFGARS